MAPYLNAGISLYFRVGKPSTSLAKPISTVKVDGRRRDPSKPPLQNKAEIQAAMDRILAAKKKPAVTIDDPKDTSTKVPEVAKPAAPAKNFEVSKSTEGPNPEAGKQPEPEKPSAPAKPSIGPKKKGAATPSESLSVSRGSSSASDVCPICGDGAHVRSRCSITRGTVKNNTKYLQTLKAEQATMPTDARARQIELVGEIIKSKLAKEGKVRGCLVG